MALRKNTSLFTGLFILALSWRVRGKMEVKMEDRVEVLLKDTAQISCVFTSEEGTGGTMIHWYMMLGEERKRIFYWDSAVEGMERDTPLYGRMNVSRTGVSGEVEVVLTIRDVQLGDEADYICEVMSLTDGSDAGHTRLRVFATPEFPSIEKEQTGISVTKEDPSKIGSCEVRNGYPKPNITWYRDQTPLQNTPGEVIIVTKNTVESSRLVTVHSELQLKVTKSDKDASFYCEVSYLVPGGTRMTESALINITVHYPSTAVNMWVESPTGTIIQGDTVEIHCQGNGYPQPPITFFHNKKELKSLTPLVLPDVTRLHNGNYSCLSFDLETFEEMASQLELFVNFLDPAVLDPKDTTVVQTGDAVSVTCNALSTLPTHTVWFKNGEQVAEGHVLKLEAELDTSGTYVCVVTVPTLERLETSGAIRVYVQGPPVISETEETETLLEERMDASVTLSCHAKGYPTPTLTWTASDSQVLKGVSHNQTEEEVTSMISVKVTSDLTVHCHAASVQGNDSKVFRIKAILQTTPPAPPTTTITTTASSITGLPKKNAKKEGNGVIIAVIIICLLLLAILGSVLYFLYKKGKIPYGRSGKQDLTKEKSTKNSIVVEMKSENNEEAVLLQGVNGEKKLPNDQ
ncbi:melanoma cell adhesion molecule b [Osmerus eperlanus]|uniref:melanoma cell adhesion molecule b n=1 Tax=Osmerus eperlanus TaxID=29151 RepID=UPI002E163E30